MRDLLELMDEVEGAAAGGVGATLEAVLTRSGYLAELEAERSVESHGRIENLQELVGSARLFDEQVERGDLGGLAAIGGVGIGERRRGGDARPDGLGARAGVPRSDLARHRSRRERSRGELGHAHDVALGEGARVPGRVPHRFGRRRVPARPQPRRSRRARRGTPALLRRPHARRGASVPVSRVEPHDVRLDRLPAAEPVPRRDPARADRGDRRREVGRGGAAAAATATAAVAAVWVRTARRSSPPRCGATTNSPRARAVRNSSGLRVGDDVHHDKFGDGVIVDITGSGDKAEARVQFRDVGEKTLLLVVGAARARLASVVSSSWSSRRCGPRSTITASIWPTVWMSTGYVARSAASTRCRRTPSGSRLRRLQRAALRVGRPCTRRCRRCRARARSRSRRRRSGSPGPPFSSGLRMSAASPTLSWPQTRLSEPDGSR